MLGALFGALLMLAGGTLARLIAPAIGRPEAATWLPRFMRDGHWLALPLGAAAVAVATRWADARSPASRVGVVAVALLLALAGTFAVVRPNPEDARPLRTTRDKTRAALRWSYRSPATVMQVVPLARDPDPIVREQAVLALSRNLVVDDIQRAAERRPARYSAARPVVDSLRQALSFAAHDPVEIVRVVAARGLWNAPRVFGAQPAAAETLAAVLDRSQAPGALERLSWIALDAAAGPADPELKAAAGRFARATADSALRAAAERAATP